MQSQKITKHGEVTKFCTLNQWQNTGQEMNLIKNHKGNTQNFNSKHSSELSAFYMFSWRRKWQPTPVFLPGESQGQGEPGGLLSMGLHRVRHN